jgi:DNA-binding transcriptional regulator PaaX
MTIPVHSPRYNKLKKHALEVFERHGGWISPPQWAVMAGFYPVRAAYSYLLRLHRFGLLERQARLGGVFYSLSEKGRRRVAWLRQQV